MASIGVPRMDAPAKVLFLITKLAIHYCSFHETSGASNQSFSHGDIWGDVPGASHDHQAS
eukprot:4386694-Pleurochrysis_carterae.AAC.2